MLVRSYNFDRDDTLNFNGDDLSDLSDYFEGDVETGVGPESLPVDSLALDDITYDRDVKWINVPDGARPKPVILAGNKALKQVQAITKDNSVELKDLDQRYASLEEKLRVQERRVLVEFDDAPAHRRRDVREERRPKGSDGGRQSSRRRGAPTDSSRKGPKRPDGRHDHAEDSDDHSAALRPRAARHEEDGQRGRGGGRSGRGGRGRGRGGEGEAERSAPRGRGAALHTATADVRSGRGRGGRGQPKQDGRGAGRTTFTVHNTGAEADGLEGLPEEIGFDAAYAGTFPADFMYTANEYGASAMEYDLGYGLDVAPPTAPRLSDRFAGKSTNHNQPQGHSHRQRARKAGWSGPGTVSEQMYMAGEYAADDGYPQQLYPYDNYGGYQEDLSLRYDAPAFTPGDRGKPTHCGFSPQGHGNGGDSGDRGGLSSGPHTRGDGQLNPTAREFVPTFSTG